MPYDNIPHVGAAYNDGGLRDITSSAQPRILAIGPASSGMTYELWRVNNIRSAEVEFGAATPVLKSLHEVAAQGADNLAVMRIGGRQGSFVVTDSAAATLTIVPEYRDDEIMDRYALAMDGTGTANRIAVYDLIDQSWVYDSDEILVINQGIVDVADTGVDLFSVGSFTLPDTMTSFADQVTGDFTVENVATITSVVDTAGTDGTSMSLVEHYAALNTAYHVLDFKDADLVTAPGAYIDAANVADGDSLNLWAGMPLAGTSDALGYVWQYIYRGKIYTYFVDSLTYFTTLGAAVQSSVTLAISLTLEAVNAGAGANTKFDLEITVGGGNTAVVTEAAGVVSVVVDVTAAVTTTLVAAGYINTALAAFALSNGLSANSVLIASGAADVIAGIAGPTLSAAGAGGNVVTHTMLTGDTTPAAVSTKFAAGSDAELREVNFAHQLASFCKLASTTWKSMIGAVSFASPTSWSRLDIADWAGQLPEFTYAGSQLVIDAPADNGVGVLGNKFLAGFSDTAGYRNAQITDPGSANDSLAYGGLITTVGASLPNGSDWPYGIDDDDEAIDGAGAPVDLGKHLLVTYDWPIHRNSYSGGTSYRGSLEASVLGRLAVMPVNEEPIGFNGVMLKVTSPPRIHSTQLDDLAEVRALGLRFEEGLGYVMVTSKTAAHPSSDYTEVSTIRCANRLLSGIRDIGKKYLGKAFTPERVISLQAALDSYLLEEGKAKIHQGAGAKITYTPADRIIGKIDVQLRFVPPFSIRLINVTLSLAADETEL